MKKVFGLFILVLFALVNVVSVSATEPTAPGIYVEVYRGDVDGHIDMLVRRSDFEGSIRTSINADFSEYHVEYETFDYLEATEWISYCAWIRNASCEFDEYMDDAYSFALSSSEREQIKEVKFIHVDSEGNTVSISDVYKVPSKSVIPFVWTSYRNNYNPLSNEFTSNMKRYLDPLMTFLMLLVLFIVIVSVGVRYAAAMASKLEIGRPWKFLLYYFVAHILMIIIGVTLIAQVDFVANLLEGPFAFFLYVCFIVMNEVGISYAIKFRKYPHKEYILFSVISYGILLVFLIFFLLMISF